MPDLYITCPHCSMRITFGIGNAAAEPRDGELLGFVFTCPSCQTPVSYQANEDHAVELDKDTFENFKKTVAKKFNRPEKLEGVAFKGPERPAKMLRQQRPLDESAYENMLKDIRECDSFDDFLKRI